MNKRVIGMTTAGTLAATAALAFTAGPAQAATCNASAGSSCVKVINYASDVQSINVGPCKDIGGHLIPSNQEFADLTVASTGAPFLLTYSTVHCPKRGQNSKSVSWSAPDADNFRTVTIR
ncbi:hypothetical protein [Streptomyces sp. NBC_00576]|uniref:hypothetical protein n=1 Tax=Streptomyces sp. NBC_00576 TaxID=2903665 RepID=UPI002E8212C2|nr:hypothetical protein [Streptomyces sp. NBC_00576]WUB76916.1 hypothetical protein OG734_46600 [Streptomyces sp. NBC_00576]